jgi:hypothetical protein
VGKIGFGLEFDEPLSPEQESRLCSMSIDLQQGKHHALGIIQHLF